MNIILTENQFQRLFDIDEADREKLGAGMHHNVYSTKFSTDYLLKQKLEQGDIVVKLGPIDIVEFYSKEFNKHPDIFPIVYKAGMKKNHDTAYMFIEKVDNKKFQSLYKMLFDMVNNQLKKDGLKPIELWKFNFTLMHLDSENDEIKEKLKDKIEYYINNFTSNELKDFYIQFKDLIEKLHYLKDDNKLNSLYVIGFDLHHGNFGITKNKKIKCIDF